MESLFSDFSPVSLDAWKARLALDLKGRTFDDLVAIDENGIPVFPFYNAENAAPATGRLFESPDWDICTRIPVMDEKTANEHALSALTDGASALIFDLQHQETIDYPALLQGIGLSHILTIFRVTSCPGKLITGFENYLEQKKLKPRDINYIIDYDPLSVFLSNPEQYPVDPASEYASYIADAQAVSQVSADATLFQNAGANSAFQLGCALAQLNEYLTILDEHKKCGAISRVLVALAVGTGFFEEIAKLRALRHLLPLLFKAYNMQPETRLHAVSSDLYRSPFDAHNNLLRDAISGMAGVLGGCDSLEIHHFDLHTNKQNPAFSERMARNQQLLFKEESYLGKVADMASGSFYIETLTEAIAKKGWMHFQEIEQKGGLLACFDQGILQGQVQQQAEQLIGEYKSGKRVLVGVNKYPNQEDMPQSREAPEQNVEGLRKINLSAELIQSR